MKPNYFWSLMDDKCGLPTTETYQKDHGQIKRQSSFTDYSQTQIKSQEGDVVLMMGWNGIIMSYYRRAKPSIRISTANNWWDASHQCLPARYCHIYIKIRKTFLARPINIITFYLGYAFFYRLFLYRLSVKPL